MRALGTLCIIAMAAVCSAFGSGISVDRLQCEFLTEPLAIDNTEPELSWKMASARKGAVSTAYQVLAASDLKKLNEQDADLWNTGKVETANEIKVKYAGKQASLPSALIFLSEAVRLSACQMAHNALSLLPVITISTVIYKPTQ